ncbi:MAG: hypothetical protein KF767_08820 [Bdellovibrionaceae bacterium]|nr:hypothetical protein [Pseudobdellovibrionaceae bacterium]
MATLSEIRDAVKDDLDLEDEDFIDNDEIDRHIRRGVKSAQKIALGLNEDYFLAKATITLVGGTAEYSLPAGIYAHKVRKLLWDDGSESYVITRVKNLENTASVMNTFQSDRDLKYLIVTTGAEPKITFYPTPSQAGPVVTIWFLRTAASLEANSDVLDVPEAYDYVVQFAKDACLNKERGTPDAQPSAALKEEQTLLEADLMNRVPDDDNFAQPDMSFYEECN